MRKRFRTRQADLLMLVSGIPMKFACQAALLPSALLAVRPSSIYVAITVVFNDVKCIGSKALTEFIMMSTTA